MSCGVSYLRAVNAESLLNARAAGLKVPGGWPETAKISFIWGFPNPDVLPHAGMLAATQRALAGYGEWPLQYDGAPGREAMTGLLVNKLKRDQGISTEAGNILLTAGSSQAIEYIAEIFLEPGDVFLCESPSFLGTLRSIRNMGARVEGIPMDEHGLRVDALEATLARLKQEGARVKMLYVIPNNQNPTGVTLAADRRARIVALAQEHNFVIVEDDAYYDINWSGRKLPPLAALDTSGRVFYTGTFSKIMAPGLRLGFMVAPRALLNRITAIHPVESAAPYSTHVAWEFCKDGGLDANIAKLNAVYQRRCETLLEALEEHMPAGVTWTRPQGGFFVWVTLPEHIDALKLVQQTRAKGVDFLHGAACTPDGSLKNGLRLSFSYAPEAQLPEGIRVLAECIRAFA
jgi:2-aminoadipate transaminase